MEIYKYWLAFETFIKWPFEELFSTLPHLPLGFILAHSILHKCGYCGSTVCANAERAISPAETHKLRSSLNTASLNTHAFKSIISHACLLKCYRKWTWKITAWNVDWNGCIPDCPQYARLLHPWGCIYIQTYLLETVPLDVMSTIYEWFWYRGSLDLFLILFTFNF